MAMYFATMLFVGWATPKLVLLRWKTWLASGVAILVGWITSIGTGLVILSLESKSMDALEALERLSTPLVLSLCIVVWVSLRNRKATHQA